MAAEVECAGGDTKLTALLERLQSAAASSGLTALPEGTYDALHLDLTGYKPAVDPKAIVKNVLDNSTRWRDELKALDKNGAPTMPNEVGPNNTWFNRKLMPEQKVAFLRDERISSI